MPSIFLLTNKEAREMGAIITLLVALIVLIALTILEAITGK